MIHIQTQNFYERHTGTKHEVTISFGGINPVSRGYYRVTVDGEFHSIADDKGKAFNDVVDIIKQNDWTSINCKEA